jgi:hypothetical protein
MLKSKPYFSNEKFQYNCTLTTHQDNRIHHFCVDQFTRSDYHPKGFEKRIAKRFTDNYATIEQY